MSLKIDSPAAIRTAGWPALPALDHSGVPSGMLEAARDDTGPDAGRGFYD